MCKFALGNSSCKKMFFFSGIYRRCSLRSALFLIKRSSSKNARWICTCRQLYLLKNISKAKRMSTKYSMCGFGVMERDLSPASSHWIFSFVKNFSTAPTPHPQLHTLLHPDLHNPLVAGEMKKMVLMMRMEVIKRSGPWLGFIARKAI